MEGEALSPPAIQPIRVDSGFSNRWCSSFLNIIANSMYDQDGSGQEKENVVPAQTSVPAGPQSPNTINAINILMVRTAQTPSRVGNERP